MKRCDPLGCQYTPKPKPDREKLRAKVLALCRDCGDCQGCGRHPCNSCCIALGLRWRDIETLLKERA